MTDQHETLSNHEQPAGQYVAFVRERFRPDDLAETLVAFANAGGGTVLVGASGQARPRFEGVRDAVATRQAILEAAYTCTPPLILPIPTLVQHAGVMLLRVAVPAGLPHVYSLHGKYVQRRDRANTPLSPDELRRLFTERGAVDWEREAHPDATLDDLDMQHVQAYVERLAFPDDMYTVLVRRGCLLRTADTGTYRPTHAGLLLFGRDVPRWFPQAYLTLVRYRGTDMSDEFERTDVHTALPQAVRHAERWLTEHMRQGSRMVGLEREDWTQFPPPAVREALVNAVAHRDYRIRGEGIRIVLFADRLECYSPGRLPGHVTLDNLSRERFSRNETLVQVLADLGLIEQLGYGIDRMVRHMQQAHLPPPTFRETAAGFLVVLQGQPIAATVADGTVDTSEWVRQGLNERQIAALLHVQEQHRITNRDLQDLVPDVSAETIRRDLADLVERGVLLKIGDRRATYYILK